jgi:hypothetical protein
MPHIRDRGTRWTVCEVDVEASFEIYGILVLEPGVGPRRWIGRLRLHAGKYILGITAPTGTGVQALPPWDPHASPFDSSYIGCMLWRVRNS